MRPPLGMVVAGFVAFFVIGGLQAVYGPCLPGLRERFGVPLAASSMLLSAHFTAALVAIVGAGALGRIALRLRLVASSLLVATGAVGFCVAWRWSMVVLTASALGLGYGGLVVELNGWFARAFGARSGALTALLNATWGVGASLTPLLLGANPERRLPVVCVLGALLATAVAVPFWSAREPPAPAPAGGAGAAPRATLLAFTAVVFFYAGVENGVGGWEVTHLRASGWSAVHAARASGAFWAALTVGRVAVASLALRFQPRDLVLGSLACSLLALLAARGAAAAPFAYAVAGLGLAGVFPMTLAWLVSALPSARAAPSLVMAGGCVGGALLPAASGWMLEWSGRPVAVPSSLAALTAASLGAALVTRRVVGRV